jgi:hypothetical protein
VPSIFELTDAPINFGGRVRDLGRALAAVAAVGAVVLGSACGGGAAAAGAEEPSAVAERPGAASNAAKRGPVVDYGYWAEHYDAVSERLNERAAQ